MTTRYHEPTGRRSHGMEILERVELHKVTETRWVEGPDGEPLKLRRRAAPDGLYWTAEVPLEKALGVWMS